MACVDVQLQGGVCVLEVGEFFAEGGVWGSECTEVGIRFSLAVGYAWLDEERKKGRKREKKE